MNTQLNTSPTNSDLAIIESWLKAEYMLEKEGFYSNWSLIVDSYQKKQLITFHIDDKPVGFVTWYDSGIYRRVNLMEIRPSQRKKGIGKAFFLEFEELTRKKGFIAIELYCKPRSSSHFWRKMKFIQFPEMDDAPSDLTFFKPLIDISYPTQENSRGKLELWDLKTHQLKGQVPRWTWDLSELSPTKPILQPCDYEWHLRWTLENRVIMKTG